MLIKYNEERTLMVPVGEGLPLLRILPQINEIPDEVWAQARPTLLNKLEADKRGRKCIEELFVAAPAAGAKAGAKVSSKAFKDLEASVAVGLVADTLDIKLLNDWKTVEKRDEVRLAIANRLDELAKRNSSKKSDEA